MISVIGIHFFYLGYGLSKSTLFRAPHSMHTHSLSLSLKKEKEKKEYWQAAKKKKIEAQLQLLFFNSGTCFFLPVDVAKC